MEENASRLTEQLQNKSAAAGSLKDFTALAHTFVYGGA